MRAIRAGSFDPGGHALRRAARVTVVGLAVFVVLGWVLDRPEAAGPAFFAVFTLGAQADFGGTAARRAARYLLTGTVALGMLALAAAVTDRDALTVAVTAVVVFTTLFLGTLGGPFYSARFPVIIAFLYGATTATVGDAVGQRLVGWSVGAAAITVASLGLWPARDLSEVPARVGDVLGRAAAVLRAPSHPATRTRLLDASHRLRIVANAEHLHAGAVAIDERRRAELVHASERLAAVCAAVVPDSLSPTDAVLADAATTALVACARALDGAPSPVRLAPPLGTALDAHAEAMAAGLARALGAGTRDAVDAAAVVAADLTATDVRIAARIALTVAAIIDEARGGAPPVGVAAAEEIDDRPDTALRAQLTMRSLWFRNALRATVALAIAMALVHAGVGHDHGFWIALGAFSVLRADLVTIGRSATATMVGTTVGFAVSSGVVVASEHVHAVLWVAFVVALFVASLGDRVRPEVGAAAFTTLIVTIYTLVEPAGLRTGEVRLVNVAIGVLITLGVTLLLWPRPGRAPRRLVADVVDHARTGLAAAVAGDRDAVPLGVVGELDRVLDVISTSAPRTLPDADRARVLVTVDLSAALAEHLLGTDDTGRASLAVVAASPHLHPGLTADAARVDGALRALVGRLARTPAPPLPPPPDAVLAVLTDDVAHPQTADAALITAGARVAASLRLIHRLAGAGQTPMRTGTLE